MKVWKAKAPSNIALVKYMGKTDSSINLPSNPSLSLTLDGLLTFVEAVLVEQNTDKWEPLHQEGVEILQLSSKGEQRFLSNWQRLKTFFGIEQNFCLRSANNFPADCGIASSASSFAALTLLAYEVCKDLGSKNRDIDVYTLANLSREASGSSCRSLFDPWSTWDGERVEGLESFFKDVFHFVAVVDHSVKGVSSSEAHQRVTSSDLFKGRPERARLRYEQIKRALLTGGNDSWQRLYQICWQEFWDMHSLFETSNPHFGYMTAGSLNVISQARKLWEQKNDGPIVTMDAGANVHFIWREDQQNLALDFKNSIANDYQVWVGRGQV